MSKSDHSNAFLRMFAAAAIVSATVAPMPTPALAQYKGPYRHCSVNYNGQGENYIIPPGVGIGGLNCPEAFWTVEQAIGKVCYFLSNGHTGIWPQLTDPRPLYGIKIKCK